MTAVLLAAAITLLFADGGSAYAIGVAALGLVQLAILAVTRGRRLPRWAATVVVTAWFAGSAAFTIAYGGLRGPAASAPLVIVVVAGLLLGRAGAIAATIATAALYVVAYALERSGTISPSIDEPTYAEVTVMRFTLLGAIVAASALAFSIRDRAQGGERSALASRDAMREFYEQLLDASPTMLTVSHVPTGRRTYVSPEFERVTGVGVDALDAMSDDERWNLIHPDDQPAAQAALESFIASKGETAPDIPGRYRTPDGWRWYLTSLSVLDRNDRTGAIEHLLFTRTDMSDQVDAERFRRAVLDGSPTAISVHNATTEVVEYVNATFENLTGYTHDEVAAMTADEFRRLIPDEDWPDVDRAVADTLATGEPAESRHRFRHADGSSHWYLARYSKLELDDDAGGPRVLVSSIDIADQVRADAIIHATPSIFMIIDAETRRIEFMNESFATATGYSMGEFNAMDPGDRAQLTPADEREALRAARRMAMESGSSPDVLHRFRRADGEIRWFEVGFARMPDGSGPPGRLLMYGDDVTARVQAEQLRSTVLDASPAAFLIFSPTDGTIEYVNPAYTAATGLTIDDLSAMSGAERHELRHPDDRDDVRAALAHTIETGQETASQHRIVRPDGRVAWLDARYTRLAAKPGESPRILMSAIDVTERMDAERLHTQMLDSSPAMFLLFDAETIEAEYANPAYVQTTGYSPAELNAMTNAERRRLRHPDDAPAVDEALAQTLETGESSSVLFRYRTATGAFRWLDARYTKLASVGPDNGTKVLVSSTDVTDRMEAEAFSQSVLRSSPALTVVVDADNGETLYVNPAFTASTGYTADALNEMPRDEMYHLTPDGQRRVVDAAIERAAHTDGVVEAERSYRGADGSVRWYDSRFVHLPGGGGRRVVITAVDTTARRETEEALRAERQRLERLNANLREFVHIASHDLQEPLRTASMHADRLNAELVADSSAPPPRSLRYVNEGIDRMRRLVAGLLDYSRIGADRTPELIDAAELAREVVADLTDLIDREQATIELAGLPRLRADRSELRLVIQNLIANAIKFRSPERTPHVSVSAARVDAAWRFEIGDNGIGIAPRHHERIFAVFRRLHREEEYEGTGIGLAHCKKAVENHGGEIGVESVEGEGSTFWFTIPDGDGSADVS